MTEVEITGRFPEGYLDEEKRYCQAEEDAFYLCTEKPAHPDKEKARRILLNKRAEFKKAWYKNKFHKSDSKWVELK